MKGKTGRRTVALVVSIALIFAAQPWNLQRGQRAQAAETDKRMGIGVSGIAAPSQGGTSWQGDYVYYGSYQNMPIKWRVLDTTGTAGSSSAQGGMLLQADQELAVRMPFEDGVDQTNKHQNGALPNNQWSVSDIRAWLQGTGSTQFLGGSNFSPLEREGIMRTSGEAGSSPVEVLKSVGLADDTMFLLDAADLLNSRYGYQNRDGFTDSSIGNFWWLRSVHANARYGDAAGAVLSGGYVYHNYTTEDGGIVPAFNLDLSKVFFVSDANAAKNESLQPVDSAQITEWKLTLLNSSQSIRVDGDITREDGEVSIPYVYSGSGANQISVMILGEEGAGGGAADDDIEPGGSDDDDESDDGEDGEDGEDSEEEVERFSLQKGVPTGEDNIKYYGMVSNEVAEKGSITFTLPDDFNEEGDTVYIFTEQVNGANKTDYASQPVEIIIPPLHEHEFPDTWLYNATEHWHTCIAPGCNGIDNEEREEHQPEEDDERSTPATCLADGVLWYTCECGYSYSQVDSRADHMDEDGQLEIDLHDFDDNEWQVIRKPTYTREGEQIIQCVLCKEWITESIDPLSEEHEFEEEIIKAATCTEEGSKRLTCMEEFCEEVRVEKIPALGHSFGEWTQTVAATTETEGVSSRTCAVCGKVETRSIPKIVPEHTHDYHVDVWVTDEEFHWHQCECGDTKSVKDHTWNSGKVLKAPTKKATGEIRYTCTVCGYKKNCVMAAVGTKFSSEKYRYQVIKGKNSRPSVTTLGFAKGKSNKTVNMPETVVFGKVTYTVREISRSAFSNNKKITKIEINNKIQKIGNMAFYRAENVTNITIGTGMEELGNHTFCHLNQLKTMIVKSKKLKDSSDVGLFHGMADFTIIVPKSKVDDYQDTVFYTHPDNVKSA